MGRKVQSRKGLKIEKNAFLNASVVIFHGQTKKKEKVKIKGHRLIHVSLYFSFQIP